VTCAISWGRSLIGLLVVMSVVVVLVLLLISFPVDGQKDQIHYKIVQEHKCENCLHYQQHNWKTPSCKTTAKTVSHLGSQMRAATL